ncbi:hypothetical protein RUM43_000908 [Polyplax serrata]|uniref:Uncharacterized protein n=1 Tax=Polyplax serrata TaxID=468196 RepID=A0AAN8SD57_POLSC
MAGVSASDAVNSLTRDSGRVKSKTLNNKKLCGMNCIEGKGFREAFTAEEMVRRKTKKGERKVKTNAKLTEKKRCETINGIQY